MACAWVLLQGVSKWHALPPFRMARFLLDPRWEDALDVARRAEKAGVKPDMIR